MTNAINGVTKCVVTCAILSINFQVNVFLAQFQAIPANASAEAGMWAMEYGIAGHRVSKWPQHLLNPLKICLKNNHRPPSNSNLHTKHPKDLREQFVVATGNAATMPNANTVNSMDTICAAAKVDGEAMDWIV
jgi:hypothetical protein